MSRRKDFFSSDLASVCLRPPIHRTSRQFAVAWPVARTYGTAPTSPRQPPSPPGGAVNTTTDPRNNKFLITDAEKVLHPRPALPPALGSGGFHPAERRIFRRRRPERRPPGPRAPGGRNICISPARRTSPPRPSTNPRPRPVPALWRAGAWELRPRGTRQAIPPLTPPLPEEGPSRGSLKPPRRTRRSSNPPERLPYRRRREASLAW
jgi:hypothetical protein